MASTTFQIDVLSVIGPNKVTKGKNSWNAIEVAYKRDGKVEGKKLVDFNGEEIFKAVQSFKQGEVYEITAEKNEATGYWDWKSSVKATAQQQGTSDAGTQQAPVAESGSRSTGGGRVTGSNYETPEERKIKQRFIVRQSSISYALDLLKHNSEGQSVSEDAVMKIADKFVAYVYESRVQDMDNDIPV